MVLGLCMGGRETFVLISTRSSFFLFNPFTHPLTGSNFQYFPDGCHLTVVDPNPNFRSYYNENRAKYPQIKSEEINVCGGKISFFFLGNLNELRRCVTNLNIHNIHILHFNYICWRGNKQQSNDQFYSYWYFNIIH